MFRLYTAAIIGPFVSEMYISDREEKMGGKKTVQDKLLRNKNKLGENWK